MREPHNVVLILKSEEGWTYVVTLNACVDKETAEEFLRSQKAFMPDIATCQCSLGISPK